jgi:hypothetical protein
MTTVLESPAAASPQLDALWQRPVAEVEELACASHLGVWTARRRGLDMSPVHWEWTELAMTQKRLAVVAPREHSKSESFSVNATAWRSIYSPATYSYLFALTGDLAEELLARTKDVLAQTRPELLEDAVVDRADKLVLGNGSMIRAAGAGKRTRGGHPDVIVGDDLLDDENTQTSLQRRKMHRWWFGSVVNMAHPGTVRQVRGPDGMPRSVFMPATRIHLVGTPFHGQDLLLSMRRNPMWRFYRYAAEFHPSELVPGTLAVEVS